jgi:hypothetical protein
MPPLAAMIKPLQFKTLRDAEGVVTVGWAGDTALHTRVEGGLSAEVGGLLASHVQVLVASATGVHYFADVSRMTRYDLLARSAFVRVALANRGRFASFTFLTWSAGAGPAAETFARALGGNVKLCPTAVDFERLLTRVAPFAKHRLNPANWEHLESGQRNAR